MDANSGELGELVRRASGGDEPALAELFARNAHRLKRMIQLRLDRRLQGRVDPSDVLQEAYIDLAEKLPGYAAREGPPFFVWMRLVVGERLLRAHRHHLGTAARDAAREISIHKGGTPQASSASLAADLVGKLTSASKAVARGELQALLQDAINAMDEVDREVIALRHFEELSNDEVAAILGLTKAAASKRYVRAMVRLKQAVGEVPGLADPSNARVQG